jgi:predicted dehydrogenase
MCEHTDKYRHRRQEQWMPIRIGLVGYGVGGRLFHTPYLQASAETEIVGVVARAAATQAAVAEDLLGVPTFDSIDALIDAGVDAVVVSTPPGTRYELVREALERGVHVVADKPLAPSAAVGTELAELAEKNGLVLNVFHNRRFDTDIVTARAVIASGELGELQRLDLRCDQDDPATLEAGPQGGLLRDLGSHTVDQALTLLGLARAVTAHLDLVTLPEGTTDAGYVLTIDHVSGAHSHVSSTKIHGIDSRELRLMGSAGSYRSDYSDVQFDALIAGRRPADDRSAWGYEREERWGVLFSGGQHRRIPSEQGDSTRYYDLFAEAVRAGDVSGGPAPVREGIEVLRVLDAARQSAAERRTVELG